MKQQYYEKLASGLQNQAKAVNSKFGSYILQKFGWQQGKGLGKNENGDVNLIKIAKHGEHGLGYEEKDHLLWWEDLYNKTAKKINVKPNGTSEKTNMNTASTKQKDEELKNSNNNIYSGFVKKKHLFVNESHSNIRKEPNMDDQKKEACKVKKKLSKKRKSEGKKKKSKEKALKRETEEITHKIENTEGLVEKTKKEQVKEKKRNKKKHKEKCKGEQKKVKKDKSKLKKT